MAVLGEYWEEIPIFGDLEDIEPVKSEEPFLDGLASGHKLQLEDCLNSEYGQKVAVELKNEYTFPGYNLSSLSGLIAGLPDEIVNSSVYEETPDIDESLATIMSLFDEDLTPALLSSQQSPSFTEEMSSSCGYSPVPEVELDQVSSPFSLSASESGSTSPCPTFQQQNYDSALEATLLEGFSPYSTEFNYADDSSYDGDYDKFDPRPSKASIYGKKLRHKPYRIPKKGFKLEDLPPVERVQRKKDQNKTAASRYRIKKKAEKSGVEDEQQVLEERNKELKDTVTSLSREIQYLKGLMKEIVHAKKRKTPKEKL